MTPEQLKAQQAASVLSPAYEGANYTGHGDHAVQFEGAASSFADEGKTGLTFSMKITNTGANAVDALLALNPGYFTLPAQIKDATGTAVAAVVTDGLITGTVVAGTNVQGIGSPKPIVDFLGFLRYNPTRFTGLKMLVDNSAQLDNVIYVKQNSPFRNLEDKQITPSIYKDSTQPDDKRVEIPLEDYQMDNNTTVITTISAGRTVTFTWFVGAILNPAYELASKAKAARANYTRYIGQR
jgi:hypothetical protein